MNKVASTAEKNTEPSLSVSCSIHWDNGCLCLKKKQKKHFHLITYTYILNYSETKSFQQKASRFELGIPCLPEVKRLLSILKQQM